MITRKLAGHASSLKFEALPARLVERLKHCVLDTLGVSIGATAVCAEAKIVCDYVRDLGGKPESRILGFGGRAPAAWAVFANGSLGHMLDYDDVGAGGHVSIATTAGYTHLTEPTRSSLKNTLDKLMTGL